MYFLTELLGVLSFNASIACGHLCSVFAQWSHRTHAWFKQNIQWRREKIDQREIQPTVQRPPAAILSTASITITTQSTTSTPASYCSPMHYTSIWLWWAFLRRKPRHWKNTLWRAGLGRWKAFRPWLRSKYENRNFKQLRGLWMGERDARTDTVRKKRIKCQEESCLKALKMSAFSGFMRLQRVLYEEKQRDGLL